MLKLLFVDDQLDDDSSSASIAARQLEKIGEYSIYQTDFKEAEQKINDIIPDLIILDLQEVAVSGDRNFSGNRTCEWIWKNRFCPIVVYSAFPDQLSDTHSSHPFIEVVKKGREGVESLKISITKLVPQIKSIQETEKSIRQEFSVAMREVAPYAYDTFKDDPDKRNDAILRSSRRRLAALMDGLSNDGTRLASWEQYLCPPVCPDTQLGDILRKVDGNDADNPASFRIVLTPSCDLVASGGRKPKVNNVLLARCCTVEDALMRIQMKPARRKLNDEKELDSFKKRLTKSVLTQGYHKMIIPLPCLEGKIPAMAADLRDLDFICLDEIGFEGKDFIRIASIDSPFRELVSWAYMQIACRPGLPDRDFKLWCDEIVGLLKEGN